MLTNKWFLALVGSFSSVWWFVIGLRSHLGTVFQHGPYLRRCLRLLLCFTLLVGVRGKETFRTLTKGPHSSCSNCWEVNFPSKLWSAHTQASFCHCDLPLLWTVLVLTMNLTSVLKAKDNTHILHSSVCLAFHSTCSGSASMQVSHGFLGIWGMERIRRAMPVRKRRTKAVQAQAKDQA